MKLLDAIKTYADAKPQAEAFRSLDHSLTYGELWDLSERVASGIQKHTADGSKAPVLVYGHMEPNMIVSFLGSVKASALTSLSMFPFRRSGSSKSLKAQAQSCLSAYRAMQSIREAI